MKVTALVPAHNEQDSIGAVVKALQGQTHPIDRIVVVCDNCTDSTAEVAKESGAEVFETVGNTKRKAGALNQAIRQADLGDFVVICDADTELVDTFVETAMERLADPKVGAVGAVFNGSPTSILESFQANEWTRYARAISRTGKVWVLSGTGAIIRTTALRQVADSRETVLPGTKGDVYLSDALTEDMELSLALKTLGWKLQSPVSCQSETELMPTWRLLWGQRERWYGGAIENIRTYGVTKVTAKYWAQQIMLVVSVFFMATYLSLTAVGIYHGTLRWTPFWIGVGVLFAVERVVTVWKAPWSRRVMAALVIPELVYALFLQAAFVSALTKNLVGKRILWVHATSTAT